MVVPRGTAHICCRLAGALTQSDTIMAGASAPKAPEVGASDGTPAPVPDTTATVA
jgi:hypothetical protein